ncbi:aspartyl-tRNA(Asn)/glutamyl-tRNA(Gln) amidotransferase subunit A [Raineyella antarctica]|uniref:Aspartyl-tRNA(Asn)/glutamyl-tRNA(Gln) amidotransferase subunit A n=1 Tax=Raineyella antarctica TaxID=1577474 RepID=A0A1G6GDB0_9ACTN|nr:amidase [Raineyella antarctica]SDB79988.1 aspartyl-tRNA(Asn)/glutamyl-tRNA(Gln) amidotransferase subunit A [Raineyella antarctica]
MTIDGVRERVARGATYEAIATGVLERGQTDAAAAHVFTATYADDALAAARAADAAGRDAGRPLAGLPVTIKDLFDVAGETSLSGTIVRRGLPAAGADAVVVSRLRRAGASIIGRTNMVEYALGGVGINPHYGTPRNPADPEVARVPGGSSSGAAVSVGLGLAVAGVGSDTAGSVRIPAALCGLVGFKPTQWRVPLTGAVELSRSLDSVGPIANSVADCLALDAVLAGVPLPVVSRPLSGLRLAAAQTLVLDDIEPAVAAAYERALRTLADAGASIEEVQLAQFGRIAELNQPAGLSPIECWAAHGDLVRAREADVDHRVAQRMRLGDGVSVADYLAIHDRRARWITETERALEPYDAFLSPTVPIVAPEIARLESSDDAYFAANRLLLRNPFIVNWLDGCAFSLPCHAPGELPVGLMVSGPRGADARIAGVASAAEAALAAR